MILIIRDCPHVTNHNCGPGEAAGAVCSNYLGPNTDWGWRQEDLVGGVREHIWVPFRVSFPRAPVFPFKVMLSMEYGFFSKSRKAQTPKICNENSPFTILYFHPGNHWLPLLKVAVKVPSSEQRGIFHITTVRFPSYDSCFSLDLWWWWWWMMMMTMMMAMMMIMTMMTMAMMMLTMKRQFRSSMCAQLQVTGAGSGGWDYCSLNGTKVIIVLTILVIIIIR